MVSQYSSTDFFLNMGAMKIESPYSSTTCPENIVPCPSSASSSPYASLVNPSPPNLRTQNTNISAFAGNQNLSSPTQVPYSASSDGRSPWNSQHEISLNESLTYPPVSPGGQYTYSPTQSRSAYNCSGHYPSQPSNPEQASRGVEMIATPGVAQAAYRRRTRPARFQCDLCGQTFTARHNLDNHNNSHMGIRPHTCHLCGRSFGTAQVCKRHVERCKGLQDGGGAKRHSADDRKNNYR